MLGTSIGAVVAFVIAGTFSPGPNNVMSSSFGMMHGYRRTLPFMLGVFVGFVLVMLVCAASAAFLLGVMPALETVLKYVGATYILWLGWTTWSKRASFGAATGDAPSRASGFLSGLALQFANPKVAVYGLMLYSTLLAGLARNVAALGVSAILLAGVAFASTSTWALAGAGIRRWLKSDRERAIVAGVLTASLVYTAVELAGIPRAIGALLR